MINSNVFISFGSMLSDECLKSVSIEYQQLQIMYMCNTIVMSSVVIWDKYDIQHIQLIQSIAGYFRCIFI